MTKKQIRKKYTTKDFYLNYPFKKIDKLKYVPTPYIKKSEDTNNEHSVTYTEYKSVIGEYFNLVSEFLLQGSRYNLPSRLGHLLLYKYKYKKENFINPKPYYSNRESNIHSNNYRVIIKWEKRSSPIPKAILWKVRPVNTFNDKLYYKLVNDLSFINLIK